MRSICVLAVIGGLSVPLAMSAQEKQPKQDAVVQEIDIKGAKLKPVRGGLKAPTVIASADELAKAIEDAGAQDTIKKAVDFAKQKLLYFAWSGSGGDKLGFTVGKSDKAPEVAFQLTRGLTRDLRAHFKLYAVPKDATWRMDK